MSSIRLLLFQCGEQALANRVGRGPWAGQLQVDAALLRVEYFLMAVGPLSALHNRQTENAAQQERKILILSGRPSSRRLCLPHPVGLAFCPAGKTDAPERPLRSGSDRSGEIEGG